MRRVGDIHKAILCVLLFVLIIVNTCNIFAQTPEIAAKVDTSKILIGEQIRLDLRVSYPKSLELSWPVVGERMGNFEIAERLPLERRVTEDGIEELQQLLITSFDTGWFVIEPLPFVYKNISSEEVDTIHTDPILIYVATVAVDTTAEIRPIKDILQVESSWRDHLPYILAAVLAVIIIVVLIFLWKRRTKKPVTPLAIKRPGIPIHLRALEQLEALEQKKLWQSGRVKEYYSELTDIVRFYIEKRFRVPALEQTTDEIVSSLKATNRNISIDQLFHILSLADLVKFAKFQPTASNNETVLAQAKEFILQNSETIREEVENG